MNTSLLSTPFINRGDPITAIKLNQLADAAKRSFLQPGQFQNSSLAVSAFGGAQSSGTTLVAALIVATVPACDIIVTGTLPAIDILVTHGFMEAAAVVLSQDENGWSAPELEDGEEQTLVAVANTSRSILRASTDDPVILLGYLTTMIGAGDSGEEALSTFVPVNWDMSSLNNFDIDKMQIPYHDEGEAGHKLDSKECDPES